MDPSSNISFEDTSIAFSYKSNNELRKANLIFSLVNHPWISSMATGFVKSALKLGLPIQEIVKKTVFGHFCGGETIEESEKAVQRLWKFRVGTILDYSVEGEKSEAGFDSTLQELLRNLEKAGSSEGIPFSVFKVTGLASFEILEKIHRKEKLSNEEEESFDRVRSRVDTICSKAFRMNVPVLIDAEESWIQDPIDQLANEMMSRYNKVRAIVFNTFQLYRTDSYDNLKNSLQLASSVGFFLGAKIVRGAYMEKERERAEKLGYPSPIHSDKESTDKAFNESLLFCMEHLDQISVMCGSHNDYSNQYLAQLLNQCNVPADDKRIWFAQLFGMSDNISFNLAKAGYNVAKYVPYGPVKSVMPYLLRRAAENTSVAGQSSRELILIRKELNRRKLA